MKISKGRLRQLIKEETERVISEFYFSNKKKADKIMGSISNKPMRGAGAVSQRQYVAKWLKKIAAASDEELAPWDGDIWPAEDERDFNRLFTLKGDTQELGGELEPAAIKVLDAALRKRGV